MDDLGKRLFNYGKALSYRALEPDGYFGSLDDWKQTEPDVWCDEDLSPSPHGRVVAWREVSQGLWVAFWSVYRALVPYEHRAIGID